MNTKAANASSMMLRVALLLLLCSCAPSRDVVYFSDLKNRPGYSEEIKNGITPRIQPGDLLSITVSCLNPESTILFNNGVLPTVGTTTGSTTPTRNNEGYVVDNNGLISFPVLGPVKLGGLTKEEATTKLVDEIKKSVKNPIVNVRFLNFRITVIGEVNRPSTFTIPNENINLLEALGLAGDLTAYGKRENVLIIREKDGNRTTTRVNLNSKSTFDSPFYYLQQNDIVYVEPVKARALQSNNTSFYLPLVTLAVSVASILLIALK